MHAELLQRIKNAYEIKVEKVEDKNITLNISWLDVHGDLQTKLFELKEGDTLEF